MEEKNERNRRRGIDIDFKIVETYGQKHRDRDTEGDRQIDRQIERERNRQVGTEMDT